MLQEACKHSLDRVRPHCKPQLITVTLSGGFTLLKSGKSNALCFAEKNKKHAGSIWHGNALTQDDCMLKCMSNSECKFFSFWHTGWCQLDRVCNHWGLDGNTMISTFGRGDGTKSKEHYVDAFVSAMV